MTALKKYVLIVAGGYGSRMGSEIPKQFLEVAGKPILIHTFEAFLRYSEELIFILVLPSDQVERWKALCAQNGFLMPHIIREGGATRFQSVKSGLAVIKDDGLVAIHDGVRPCVPTEVISSAYQVAEKERSAIVSTPVRDSLRIVDDSSSRPLSRDEVRIIQTPQTFWVSDIKKAYEMEEQVSFTDDATVFEFSGGKINLIEGSPANIKITTPGDLKMAEGLLA